MMREGSRPTRVFREFLLIFVGVVLALAADDWRESREQRAGGWRALNAMLADLSADSAVLVRVAASYAADDSSATRLLGKATDPAFPRDSVERHLRSFYLGIPYAPSRAAFTAALQTGALEFLPNDALRLSVVSYFDQTSAVFGNNFMELLRELSELHDLLKPHLMPQLDSTAVSSWPVPDNPRRLDSSWDELRSDNALMVQLLEFAIYSGYMVDFAQRRLMANLELQSEIRRELGPSG